MIRPLRNADVAICICRGKNGLIIDPCQYQFFTEGILNAIVTSKVLVCKKVVPILTGSPRIFINARNAAYDLSIIPCGKGIPSTIRTYIGL